MLRRKNNESKSEHIHHVFFFTGATLEMLEKQHPSEVHGANNRLLAAILRSLGVTCVVSSSLLLKS